MVRAKAMEMTNFLERRKQGRKQYKSQWKMVDEEIGVVGNENNKKKSFIEQTFTSFFF